MDGPPQDEAKGTSDRRSIRRVLLRRAIPLAITAVGLYVVWPALLDVFSAWPRLLTLDPVWMWLAVLAELASFAVLWELQRIALRSDGWFLVVTSQLAGNAFSRIVPGGAPAGAALQYRMLTVGGLDGTSTAVGLTTVSLLTTATTFALPVLSVPAIVSGITVDEKLSNAAWLGLAIFVVLFAVGVAMLVWDAPLRWVGRAVESILRWLKRGHREQSDLAFRLVIQRNLIRNNLGSRWGEALATTIGRSLLDYLALLAALRATGSQARPSLVLLAFVISQVLGIIPITPGGLGFVEAGLATTLGLAGVSGAQAVLATLAYRMVSYWLPLIAGAVAYPVYRRRYRTL
jgi:putative heme transporter